jgi:hypothetical protein
MAGLFSKTNAAPLVAVRKNLDLVWVWFYKEVAPTALFKGANLTKWNSLFALPIAQKVRIPST